MKLSSRTQAIIAHAGLHADDEIPALARRAKCHSHTIRYTLRRLSERGLLRKRWVIDLMACGWIRYEIFFTIAAGTRKSRQRSIEWLTRQEFCTYLAEVGGAYDYEIILLAKNSRQAKEVLSQLHRLCGELCFSKVVAQHTKVSYFPRKYLNSAQMRPETLSLECSQMDAVIDEFDHSVLKLLSEEPDISQREISRKLSCTPLTISRRLEGLRAAGVIRGAMYSINSSAIGAQNYIILIFARGLGTDLTERLYQFCIKHPHCTNMKECFGSWDFEVGVEVLEHSTLLAIKEELLEHFSDDIQSVTVLSRFATLKYDLYPLKRWYGADKSH
jgi:DNA-binding Lrp family transcriptional regulator